MLRGQRHAGLGGGTVTATQRRVFFARLGQHGSGGTRQGARLFDLNIQVNHAVLHHLVCGDRTAELFAGLEIVQGNVKCACHHAHGLCAMRHDGAVHGFFQQRQHLGSRPDGQCIDCLHPLHPQLSRVLPVIEHLWRDREAPCGGRDKEQAVQAAIGKPGRKQIGVGAGAARHQRLLAIQAKAFVDGLGAGANGSHIEPCAGFPGCEGHAQASVGDAGQPLHAHGCRCHVGQQHGAQYRRSHKGLVHQAATELLGNHADVRDRSAQPAVFLWHRQAQPAKLGEFIPAFGRAALRVVYRIPPHGIAVAALNVLAHAVSQHLLGVIKEEVAHSPSTCLARMLCWISLEPPAMV